MLKVEGAENKDIYSGQQDDRIYQSEGGASQTMPDGPAVATKPLTKEEKITQGKALYTSICQACHQADASGINGSFPPLAKSDYFNSDRNKAIRAVVHGLSGKITVNGKVYDGIMPKQTLSDAQKTQARTNIGAGTSSFSGSYSDLSNKPTIEPIK